jgi:hypothetical protein
MSKAVPSKPPIRPFRPSYAVTTTTRVPGQRTAPILPDRIEPSPPATDGSDGVLA